MKDIFPEYFVNQNKIDMHELDDSTLIIFDTNILLELYRASKSLKTEIINSIKKVQDNVWMPYQIGFEFNRNRKSIFHGIEAEKKYFIENLKNNSLSQLEESIKDFERKNNLFEELVGQCDQEFSTIKKAFESQIKKIEKKIINEHQEDIMIFIEKIFLGKVADNRGYNYEEWGEEAKKRFIEKRPPGYEDIKEKKDQIHFINNRTTLAAHGDFFIWKEMILKAKEEQIKEVVFVTNDVKEDWFYKAKGKKIGARIELVEEMRRESAANFRILTNDSFLFHTAPKEKYRTISQEAKKSEVNFEKEHNKQMGIEGAIISSAHYRSTFDSKWNLDRNINDIRRVKDSMLKLEMLKNSIHQKIISIYLPPLSNSFRKRIESLEREFYLLDGELRVIESSFYNEKEIKNVSHTMWRLDYIEQELFKMNTMLIEIMEFDK